MARAGDRRGRLGPARAAGAVPGRRASPTTRRDPRCSAATGRAFSWRGIEVSLSVPGAHNAVNAAGALTAAALAGADPARAAAALADFRGARRRFELLGSTAAGRPRSTTTTPTTRPRSRPRSPPPARSRPARLVAVFQPHLYSRTRALAREFGGALAGADAVVVLPVYPARERGRGLSRASTASWSPAAAADAGRGPDGGVDAGLRRCARASSTGDAARRRSLPGDGRRATSTRWRAVAELGPRDACGPSPPDRLLRCPRMSRSARRRRARLPAGAPDDDPHRRAGRAVRARRVDRRSSSGCSPGRGAEGLEVGVVGSGSNLLVADVGVRGLVLKLDKELSTIELDGTRIRCGGGARLPPSRRGRRRPG